MATLPGAWQYGVSAGTGRHGVNILGLGEVESLINSCLRVAARKIEQIRPWDTLACCWDVKQPTSKQLYFCLELHCYYSWYEVHQSGLLADTRLGQKEGSAAPSHWVSSVVVVGWLLACLTSQQHVSVSQGTHLLRQFYVLSHWDKSCTPNFPSHPVTVYWHCTNQSQRWPYE